jgi:hypothetical protein
MRNAVWSRLLAVAALVSVCMASGGCKEEPAPVTPPPPPSAPPAPRADAAEHYFADSSMLSLSSWNSRARS